MTDKENKLYWIWLSLLKIPPHTMKMLIGYFSDAHDLYNANDFSDVGELPVKVYKQLMNKSLAAAEKIYDKVEEIGGYAVGFYDKEYPAHLREIASPPMVLYMKGRHINWDEKFSITVVGTREHTDYGRASVETITRGLVGYDTVIVTGMARGIDAIANCAALRSGGMTAAVLGGGIDVIYPPEYAGLYRAIIKNGVVISEFPPGTPPYGRNFPRRNRVLAGMTDGVLVGQAPIGSGALITAAHAISEGRNLYAIPSDIFDMEFAGTHELIAQGAKLVTCAGDIAEDYGYKRLPPVALPRKTGKEAVKKQPHTASLPPPDPEKQISMEGLNDTEIKIVKLLCKAATDADELSRQLGISSNELSSMLTMLEIGGTIKKISGNIYSIDV